MYINLLLRRNVYIFFSDTSRVQHMYTIHPAGPLGQVTETIAQRAKVLSDIQSHRVQVELIFTW